MPNPGRPSGIRQFLLWSAYLAERPRLWFPITFASIPFCFTVDHFVGVGGQWALGLIGWWGLLGALTLRETPDRVLVLILVALATGAEFTFSEVLGWYTYRLENIPAWIPPAHGIVFLTALMWSEQDLSERTIRRLRLAVTAGAITYGIAGLLVWSRPDVVGAICGGMLVAWLWLTGEERGRFYVMMWIIVCYLEACGVLIGAWDWAPEIPLLGLSEANPPSGIVGVYGLFDLIAFGIAAGIVKLLPDRLVGELHDPRKRGRRTSAG